MKIYEKITRAGIYIVFLILLILSFSKKVNVNIDEVYSYGLANHYGERRMSFEDGIKYVPAGTPWLQYVTVSDDHRFDYANVWSNQTSDVHPPFYYVIMHTICSFFPGRFSLWFGGVINIFFCLISLLVFEKLVGIYIEDTRVKLILAAAYGLAPAFLNMAMFIRMYTMAMFCTLLFTYFYIRYVRGEDGKGILAALTCTAVLGTMTHYYCMIFVVLLSVSYGVYSLFKRKFAALLKYTVSMLVAAGLCVAIFPGILGHFFNSDRGEETISNAGSDSVLRTNLWKDVLLVTNEIFGNPILLCGIVFAVLLLLIIGYKKCAAKINAEFVLVFVAVAGYMVMISATAPYATDRYFFPIYGVLFALVSIPCANVIKAYLNGKKAVIVTFAALFIITCAAWRSVKWDYTESYTKDSLQWAGEHSDLDAVMIHGARFRMHTSFLEASEYASMTLVDHKELSGLPNTSEFEDRDFVLMVAAKEDDEDYLEEVMKRYPGHSYSRVAYSGYHSTYYFTCSE
ncbi:glycosyltransferase family 39 protein [Butyrivibrio sp. XPD2002]|uniref:glycosyltransferase family 39 protein n=1 Tax=Butyrivibrio sp. XPD2002 TaxID=1280665 RepID=UPI000429037F|nr:glycosyltransferase family 39 protein [Butyrivibrio sp. XPD2002]